MGDRDDLQAIAHKIADAITPGGHLLMAHAHAVVDEPDRTGFDWDVPFGAKTISDTFALVPSLCLAKEIWTPLYRIQLFQNKTNEELGELISQPQVTKFNKQPTALEPEVESHVLWHGGEPVQYALSGPILTYKLPILMYHQVAPTGASKLNRWRLTPDAFEEQLRYLRDAGYYSVSVDTWHHAIQNKKALPGQAILLTFDDGFLDFFTYAHPLLKQYGFSALVFLVADQVGHSNNWDTAYGEELPLMNWNHIRQLQAEGIQLGSHSATHRPLTSLSVAEIVKEGVRSRTILTQELGKPVQTIAYPYGDVDPVVQHLIGACGYTTGLSCRSGHSSFQDSPLLLPRIEVEGSTSLQEFVKKLSKD
jgi:peptidoglycan/xylan/chitin deacetylase (PgdA/CDA1 family)